MIEIDPNFILQEGDRVAEITLHDDVIHRTGEMIVGLTGLVGIAVNPPIGFLVLAGAYRNLQRRENMADLPIDTIDMEPYTLTSSSLQ